MNIEFTGAYALNEDFGINFQAKVDGVNVPCMISIEALDDIDPDNRYDKSELKFLKNQYRFQSIAEEKIQNGQLVNGKVSITHSDVP